MSKPILVKACLNGSRQREEHATIPISPEELAADARRAVEAGAGEVNAHPRLPDGRAPPDPQVYAEAVAAIQATCLGVPFG